MGAVTERRIVAVLTAAQGHHGGFLESEVHWIDACALMGTIAERWLGTAAASTPTVLAGGELHDVGPSFCDDGISHDELPVYRYSQV